MVNFSKCRFSLIVAVIAILSVSIVGTTFAQFGTISGSIIAGDSNDPMAGANVIRNLVMLHIICSHERPNHKPNIRVEDSD